MLSPLLRALVILVGAVTAFWRFVLSSSVGWLTFALIRPTIPAWTAAASC